MKRWICIMLCAAMVLCLAACGNSLDNSQVAGICTVGEGDRTIFGVVDG